MEEGGEGTRVGGGRGGGGEDGGRGEGVDGLKDFRLGVDEKGEGVG